MNDKKTEFLILRVGKEFKKKLLKKATKKGENISKFVRGVLEQFFDAKK